MKRKDIAIDVLWNCLGIACIGLSVCMIIFALSTIIKEWKEISHLQIPSKKIPPWYTNTTLRKHGDFLCTGVLLIAAMADLYLFQKHVASAVLWASLIFFLASSSRLAFTLFEEVGHRAVRWETGEDIPGWLRSFHFHQGIATTIFWFGMSLATLLNGLVAIKVQTFEATDRIAWIWESLIIVGSLYWLSVRVIQEVKKRRARSSSSQPLH